MEPNSVQTKNSVQSSQPPDLNALQDAMVNGTPDTGSYRPNQHKSDVRRTVYQRFYWLRNEPLRSAAEKDWELADKEFNMHVPEIDPDDWRSHLELPDAFAAIQAQMQETIERKARPYLSATEESDEPTAEFANCNMEYNMNNTDFDYQYFLAKLAAASRGTSFLMDYWRTDKRTIQDPTSIDKDGNISYTTKEVIDFDDDYTEWVPNEFIYIDEKAKHISEAVDMFKREIINIDEFHRIYGAKPGFYDTQYVRRGGDTSTRSFFQMPRDVMRNDVEVLHYFNRSTDAYWVVANNVAIYDGPLPTKHKELPVAVQYQYRVPGQFWGMGIPKVIYMLSEERKAIRRLQLDRQKLQIGGAFLHNSAYDLDDEDTSLVPGRFIPVDTNGQPLSNAIQQVNFGDVPPSYWKSEEILLEDIKRAHGIDDRVQGVNVGGTATEAALLKESSLKRINMISITSEMDTIIRLGRLKWSNIQWFYPVPRFEKIYENDQERDQKVFRQITVAGKKFSIVDNNGAKALKMDEIQGSSALRLDKSMAKYFEGSYDISINSDIYTPPSKALYQAQFTQMLSLLVGNPVTLSSLDGDKIVSMAAKSIGSTPEQWLKGDGVSVEDMQMLAEAEDMIMAAGQPLSPTPNATIEHTQVHLQYTKTAEFMALDMKIKQLFQLHIMGEDAANPATAGGAGNISAGLAPGGVPPGPGGNQNAFGQPGPELAPNAGGAAPTPQVADLAGANFAQPPGG